jgi:hypothetical protein
MFVGKISLDTQISRTLIGVYGRNGIGKTTSLLLLLLEQGTRVLYLSTETGFRVLQSTLKLIESLYKQALSGKTLDEIMDEFRLERPSLSRQMEEILREALVIRSSKPEDFKLEIDHIHIDCMNDLTSDIIWKVYEEKGMFHGINMETKDVIVLDTLTYFSDLVVKERQLANKNNKNGFATWGEHSVAIKTLLDRLLLARGIKIVMAHEGYNKDLKKTSIALQGDAVKTDIFGKFNIVLFATEYKKNDDDEVKRVFITNPNLLTDLADCKSQDTRLAEIEPMDMNKIVKKLSN